MHNFIFVIIRKIKRLCIKFSFPAGRNINFKNGAFTHAATGNKLYFFYFIRVIAFAGYKNKDEEHCETFHGKEIGYQYNSFTRSFSTPKNKKPPRRVVKY